MPDAGEQRAIVLLGLARPLILSSGHLIELATPLPLSGRRVLRAAQGGALPELHLTEFATLAQRQVEHLHIHMHIYTHIHTYIHTYIHASKHT